MQIIEVIERWEFLGLRSTESNKSKKSICQQSQVHEK